MGLALPKCYWCPEGTREGEGCSSWVFPSSVPLPSSGWAQTQDSSASASQALGLQACATVSGFNIYSLEVIVFYLYVNSDGLKIDILKETIACNSTFPHLALAIFAGSHHYWKERKKNHRLFNRHQQAGAGRWKMCYMHINFSSPLRSQKWKNSRCSWVGGGSSLLHT